MRDNANPVVVFRSSLGKEERAAQLAPVKIQARIVVHSAVRPKGFFARCLSVLRGWLNIKAPTEHLHLVRPATAAAKPIAFKGATAVTLMTPVGSYAGKTHKEYLRVLAEQAFETMNSSSGATIN